MRRYVFYLALLTAAVSLVAYYWPVSREVMIAVKGANDKIGFINSQGRVIFEPKWHEVTRFDDKGIAHAQIESMSKWHFLDKWNGAYHGEWTEIDEFDNKGMALARDEVDVWYFIRRDGTVVNPDHPIIPEVRRYTAEELRFLVGIKFDDGDMAPVPDGANWGWMNRKGQWAIAPDWNRVGAFQECELAVVTKGAKDGLIDRNGDLARTGCRRIVDVGKCQGVERGGAGTRADGFHVV